jgi:hypothetical protein
MEIPHANDFLIRILSINDAIEFILWSQHLVLHTRSSISLCLDHLGFSNIIIKGVQRYSLANHIHWMLHAKPGGHLSPLSIMQTHQLVEAYSNALGLIDSNDTLYVVATKPSKFN